MRGVQPKEQKGEAGGGAGGVEGSVERLPFSVPAALRKTNTALNGGILCLGGRGGAEEGGRVPDSPPS